VRCIRDAFKLTTLRCQSRVHAAALAKLNCTGDMPTATAALQLKS